MVIDVVVRQSASVCRSWFGIEKNTAVWGHVDIEYGMPIVKPGGRTTGDDEGEVNGVLSDAFMSCPLLKHECCYMTTEWTIISAMAGMEVSFVTPARTVLEWVKEETGLQVNFEV
jgi:hypothetical protein